MSVQKLFKRPIPSSQDPWDDNRDTVGHGGSERQEMRQTTQMLLEKLDSMSQGLSPKNSKVSHHKQQSHWVRARSKQSQESRVRLKQNHRSAGGGGLQEEPQEGFCLCDSGQ